jgi:hypothetical protein
MSYSLPVTGGVAAVTAHETAVNTAISVAVGAEATARAAGDDALAAQIAGLDAASETALAAETAARVAGDGAQDHLRRVHEARRDNPHEVTKAQMGLSRVDNLGPLDMPVSTAQAAALASIERAAIVPADRPGEFPEHFTRTLSGDAGAKPRLTAAVVHVAGAGACFAQHAAGIVARRAPVAIGAEVIEVSARFARTTDGTDPTGNAVVLRAAWLNAGGQIIADTALATAASPVTGNGLVRLAARVSRLTVDGVIAPPTGAESLVAYLRCHGEDGVTGVDYVRAEVVTALHLAEIGDLSGVVAAATAATAAANAASLTATETLATMASVADYTRPAGVGVITLRGGYAPFDGQGGQWAYDAGDTTTAADPPRVLVGDDGARWKRIRRDTQTVLQAWQVGLIGDGVTSNATGGIAQGIDVDLMGGVYLVDEVPSKFRAFNGVWLVDGVEISAPDQAAPIFGPHVALTRSEARTFWHAGAAYDAVNNWLHIFKMRAANHETSTGSTLDWVMTRDLGQTVHRGCTIFSDADFPRIRAAAMGQMDGGRVGGIVAVQDGSVLKCWFLYSDDLMTSAALTGAPTWTRVELTGLEYPWHQVYGMLIRDPETPGRFMVGSYHIGGKRLGILETLDNGATWSDRLMVDETGVEDEAAPSEASIVWTPQGWVAFCRVDGGNMHVTTSADGETWTDLEDTGIDLRQNPVHAVYDGGVIELLLSWRGGFPGAQLSDGFEAIRVSPALCFADPGAIRRLPRRRVADAPVRAIGYWTSVQIPRNAGEPGPWMHLGKCGEASSTVRGSHAYEVRLSSVPAAAPDMDAGFLITENPGFGLSRRGTSFAASTALRPVADAWTLTGNAAAEVEAAAEWAPLTAAQRGFFPWLTHGLTLTSDGTATNIGLRQRFVGDDARRMAASCDLAGTMTVRAYGFGAPPWLSARLAVGGTAIPTDGGLRPPAVPAHVTGAWMIETRYSVGALPVALTAVSTFDTILDTGGTPGGQWDCTLAGVYFWLGERPEYEHLAQDMRPNSRRLLRWGTGTSYGFVTGHAVSGTVAEFVLPNSDMVSRATSANVTCDLDDLRVQRDVTPANDLTVSAVEVLSADSHLPRQVRLRVTTPGGLTIGQGVTLKLANDGCFAIDMGI